MNIDDDFEAYLAENMEDPAFARAYIAAELRGKLRMTGPWWRRAAWSIWFRLRGYG